MTHLSPQSTSTTRYQAWTSLHHSLSPTPQPPLPGRAVDVEHRANSGTPEPAKQEDTIIKLLPLPPRSSSLIPADHEPFPVEVSYTLIHPLSLRIVTERFGGHANSGPYINKRTAQVLCAQISTIYISASHSVAYTVHELVGKAATAFGIGGLVEEMEGRRWVCAVVVACEGFDIALGEGNKGFVFSASRQGGWSWRVYVVEVERDGRGGWESLR